MSYDPNNVQLLVVDRGTNKLYRLNPANGNLINSFSLANVSSNISYPVAADAAQDGTLFILDRLTLAIYNYTDLAYVSYSPAFIARDLLQSMGGHKFSEFDFSWNVTAAQMSGLKCRDVINKTTDVVTYIFTLLQQFNVAFSIRFGKFSLFWITWANFTTTGKLVKEKDIKLTSFNPQKEMNQYFNTAQCTYAQNAFLGTDTTSDTYVSTAGIAFNNGKQVTQQFKLDQVYRRADIDELMSLYVKLAVPDPEFITATFGFRVIRAQIQDFFQLLFSEDGIDPKTGAPIISGRRYNNIPCMIRSLKYDLSTMEVGIKLWSLGTTQFGSYVPPGAFVGGESDKIVLTNYGRLGYISPMGTITAVGSNTLTLANVSSMDAEHRTYSPIGLVWTPGYKCALVDGVTKETLQTLTIASVSLGVVTFVETIVGASNTTKNGAGFVNGGTFLQYADYDNLTSVQRALFASFSPPTAAYPTSGSAELTEQQGGLHDFDDGGLPYVLYPIGFTSF